MAKVYRASQEHLILGPLVFGVDMHKYGLPYLNGWGLFLPSCPDHIDLMLTAVETFPELHVVTRLSDTRLVNRYEEKDAFGYYLYLGNADPEIEFSTEWDPDDYPPEAYESSRKFFEEFRENPFGPLETMAIQWLLKDIK